MEPKPIYKLEQEVINKIAAGEVIQRPANALKELIENSLDAHATNIQITVKNGGLKLLQIQDNGTGIHKESFDIICERFTTSKLQEYEDLAKIATYGFRGEALASISHVAHLSITSKTKKDICAHYAEFFDGKLKDSIKPLAGNQGTIITVEDLFYNMKVRKQALRSPAEEYQKISDVVSKYAIHNASIGFALKKHGGNNDIRTPVNSNHIENIRLIYGNTIAKALEEFELKNDNLQFKMKCYLTNVNYSDKKFKFLLFINHRLVDCQSLKKSIDAVYQNYLPKSSHPFIYMHVDINPQNIDVNIHPTKHEVHLLNEHEIITSIVTALEDKLIGSNSTRIFYTQSKLPALNFEAKNIPKDKTTNKNTTLEPKYVIRTDAFSQKLDKFLDMDHSINKENLPESSSSIKEPLHTCYRRTDEKLIEIQQDSDTKTIKKRLVTDNCIQNNPINCDITDTDKNIDKKCDKLKTKTHGNNNEEKCSKSNNKKTSSVVFEVIQSQEEKKCELPLNKHFMKKITKTNIKLTSVLQLRKAIEENCHRTLRDIFAQHVYVGAISPKQALIQYNIQLLMCNTNMILEELFYQFILYNFQNFRCYKFSEPLSIKELALIGLDQPETGWEESDGPKEELAEQINKILNAKGAMINEYFGVRVQDGMLYTLPILLDNYLPNLSNIPLYVIRLATEVNWETEKECFETFARETAKMYADVFGDVNDNGKTWEWITENVLYPAIKEYFIPPKHFTENGVILEIASIPNLYKVFERC